MGLAVHSSGELGIQLATMLHLGAALPNLGFAADAHYHHLTDDIIKGGKMQYRDGKIAVPKGPGLGVELDRDKLAEYAELYKELGGYTYDRDPGRPGLVHGDAGTELRRSRRRSGLAMVKTFPLKSDAVSLGVTETGGQLSDVAFIVEGRQVAPMHTAPWTDEALPADTPDMLRILRGDFFCAPFGASDVLGGTVHGLSAGGTWRVERSDGSSLDAVLDGDIMGARLEKHVELRPGHAIVYQRHTFTGGEGRVPVGHHAMLVARTELLLGFAPFIWAGTPPEAIETPPTGRTLLAYPQEMKNLTRAALAAGGTTDLTRYPTLKDHEELWTLVADAKRPFAWTAATAPDEGWVWFSLKAPRLLPETIVWMSNGGRSYAPWSDRHRRVIGLEDVCSYFHLGHAKSIADNPISRMGVPTAITLTPGASLAIPYAFGLAPAPRGFGAVADIRPAAGGVVLVDGAGREVFAACDLGFVTGP